MVKQGPSTAPPVRDGLIKIINPFEYSVSSDPKPLATVTIDKNGCFMASEVTVPFTGVIHLQVTNATSTTKEKWSGISLAMTATVNKVYSGLVVPAWTINEVEAWAPTIGTAFNTDGLLLLRFIKKGTQDGVPGVSIIDSTASTGGARRYFFDADPTVPPLFDLSATLTTTAGMVAIVPKQGTAYTAVKNGVTLWKDTGIGNSGLRVLLQFSVN